MKRSTKHMTQIFRYLSVFLLAPQWVLACQQCFGANVNTATTRGIGFAMLALLVFTGFVSTGIVMFFININKRSKIVSGGKIDSSPENLDHLLDKINESGFHSLSRKEKTVLQEIANIKS